MFSTVELAVAFAVLLIVSVGVIFVMTRAMTQTSRAVSEQGADRALAVALEHAQSQGFEALLTNTFTPAEPRCNPYTGELDPNGSASCIEANNSTYIVTYEVKTADDLGSLGTFIAEGGSYGVDLTVRTTTDNGNVARTRRVAPPFAGFGEGIGALRVVVEAEGGATLPNTTLYLVDAEGNRVANAGLSGGAATETVVFLVPAEACTRAEPCQVGLTEEGEWWRTTLADGSEWGVAGAVEGRDIVVSAAALAETSLTLFAGGEMRLNLLVKRPAPPGGLPERIVMPSGLDYEGSFCVWVSFIDEGVKRVVPKCNLDNASEIVVDEYEVDGNTYLIPSGIPITVTVDHPNGTCPPADGMMGHTSSGWDSRAVCSSWTWGYPTQFSRTGVEPAAEFDGIVQLTIVGGESESYDLIWQKNNDGRPAAGYEGEVEWRRPREAPGCSLDGTCLPLGYGNAPEPVECPNQHCFSIASAPPVACVEGTCGEEIPRVGTPPNDEPHFGVAVEAGEPTIIEVGGLDPDGDNISLTITSLPEAGNLIVSTEAGTEEIQSGEPIFVGKPSGHVVQLVYYSQPSDSGTQSFRFHVTDHSGQRLDSEEVQVNLVLTAGVATIVGNHQTALQGATGVEVTGTLYDGFGEPVEGEVVTFESTLPGIVVNPASAVSDQNGVATVNADIIGAPVGTHQIIIRAAGATGIATIEVQSVVTSIEASYQEVQQGSGTNVTVTATDAGGSPTPGVVVAVDSISGPVLSRPSAGADENGNPVANNAGRYHRSVFNKAIAIAAGTTNHVPNPNLEDTDTTSPGWDENQNGTTYPTGWNTGYLGDVDNPEVGYHAHLRPGEGRGGGAAWAFYDINSIFDADLAHRRMEAAAEIGTPGSLGWAHGTKVTVSADVKTDHADKYIRIGLRQNGTLIEYADLRPAHVDEWQRVAATFTLDASDWMTADPVELVVEGHHADNDTEARAWVDNLAVETSSTHHGFAVGSRANEVLALPGTGVVDGPEGTIEILFTPVGEPGSAGVIFAYGGGPTSPVTADDLRITWDTTAGKNMIGLHVADGDLGAASSVTVELGDDLEVGKWYWVVARWDLPGQLALTVHDVASGQTYAATQGSVVASPDFSEYGTAYLGGTGAEGSWANIMVDELHISGIARSDAEVANRLEDNLPPVADFDTTLLHHFDGAALTTNGLTFTEGCATGGDGTCQFTVNAGAAQQSGTYRVRITSGGLVGYGALTVNQKAATIDAPDEVVLKQKRTAEVAVAAFDGAGVAMIGRQITFNEASNRFDIVEDDDSDGSVVVTTNAAGQARIGVAAVSGATPGSGVLTVSSGDAEALIIVEVVAAPSSANTPTFNTEPDLLDYYQVTVYDDNNQVMPGAVVTVTSNDQNFVLNDGDNPYVTSTLTDENGVAAVLVYVSGQVEPGLIEDVFTVTIDELAPISVDAVVAQRVFEVIFDEGPYVVEQGGSVEITGVAYDNLDNPVNGPALTPAEAGQLLANFDDDRIIVTPGIIQIGADGTFTFTVTADITAAPGPVELVISGTRGSNEPLLEVRGVKHQVAPYADPVVITADGFGNVGFVVTDRASRPYPDAIVDITTEDTEIELRPALIGSPLAWWRLGEDAGSTAFDSTGNGRDATYGGVHTLGQAGVLNYDPDTSVRFGAGGHIQTDIDVDDELAGAFSASGWIQIRDLADGATLIWGGDDEDEAFYLRLNASGELEVGVGGFEANTGIVLDDEVHHVAFTVTPDPFELGFDAVFVYVDGEPVWATVDPGVAAGRPDANLIIGHPDGDAEILFDEWVVWDSTISNATVATQYMTGVDGGPRHTVAITDAAGIALTAARALGQVGEYEIFGDAGLDDNAALILIVGDAVDTVRVVPTNRVHNAGFETGDAEGWDGAVASDVDAYTGGWSGLLALDADANHESIATADTHLISVEEGDLVGVSARIHTSEPGLWVNVRVELLDETGTPIAGDRYLARDSDGSKTGELAGVGHHRDSTAMPAAVADGWMLYEFVSEDPVPAGASYARIEVFTESSGEADVLVDEVRLWVANKPIVVAPAGSDVPVYIEVLDATGAGVEGIEVSLTETSPDASFNTSTITSAEHGIAYSTLNVPAEAAPGEYSITATQIGGAELEDTVTLLIVGAEYQGLAVTYYDLNGDRVNLGQQSETQITATSEAYGSEAAGVVDGVWGEDAGAGDEWRSVDLDDHSITFDFGGPKTITEVWLYAASELGALGGVVEHSNNGDDWAETASFEASDWDEDQLRIAVDGDTVRYLRITLDADTSPASYVGLGEVKVLSGSPLVNLARNPDVTATASSEFDGRYLAGNAIDGHTPPPGAPGYFQYQEWATAGGTGAGNWLQVDLGRDAWVHFVTVYDRPGADDFGDFTILSRAANQDPAAWHQVMVATDLPGDGTPKTYVFDSPIQARYLRFESLGVGAAGTNIGLSEVEVWGSLETPKPGDGTVFSRGVIANLDLAGGVDAFGSGRSYNVAMEAEGLLTISEGGTYTFYVDAVDDVVLEVDGTRMVSYALAAGAGWSRALTGDFNGDGYDDVVTLEGATGDLWVRAGSADGLRTPKKWAAAAVDSTGGAVTLLVGDFNGDGRDDLAWYAEDGNGDIWVAVADDDAFDAPAIWGSIRQNIIRLPGSNGVYVAAADSANLELGASGEVEVWVRTDWETPGRSQVLAAKSAPSEDSRSWEFILNSDGSLRLVVSADGVTTDVYSSTKSVAEVARSGQLIPVSVKFDLAVQEASFYADGQLLGGIRVGDLLSESLAAHYDATSLIYLADGSSVPTWHDRSGNGHHISQATAGNQPTFHTTTFGGRPAVRFDGDDRLWSTTTEGDSLDLRTEHSIFLVANPSSWLTNTTHMIFKNHDQGADDQIQFGLSRQPAGTRFYSGETTAISGVDPDLGVPTLLNSVWDGEKVAFYHNRQLQAVETVSGVSPFKPFFNIGGRSNTMDGTGQGIYNYNGDIAEVLIYGRALTDIERNLVEEYLSSKWGLNVPVTDGLAAHYDASTISGLSNGAAVPSWADRSGNGQHVANSNADTQPSFLSNGLNGKPLVRFDGTEHLHKVTAANDSLDIREELSIFALLVPQTTGNGHVIFKNTNTGDTTDTQFGFSHQSSTTRMYVGGSSGGFANSGAPFVIGQPLLMEGIWDGDDIHWYHDGVHLATSPLAANPTFKPNFVIGGRSNRADGSTANNRQTVDIAEILIYNRAVTPTERQQIESYLQSKWLNSGNVDWKPWDGDSCITGQVSNGVVTETITCVVNSWERPGLTRATIEAWGAGGQGGPSGGAAGRGGGGGGGAYARSTIELDGGAAYNMAILNSTESRFRADTTTLVSARAGSSGTDTGGVGGSAANSTGQVTYSGGNGANSGGPFIGGGGGAAANPFGNGAPGSSGNGGVGVNGAGSGGNGGNNAAGQPGTSPGGGGGGQGGLTDTYGVGAGGDGVIRIHYLLADIVDIVETTYASDTAVTVGSDADGGRSLLGEIGRVRIWGDLDRGDLRADWNASTEGAGATSITNATTGPILTLTGVEVEPTYLPTRHGVGVLDLRKSSADHVNYGYVADHPDLDLSREFAIEFVGTSNWIADAGTSRTLVSKFGPATSNQRAYVFDVSSDLKLRLFISTNGSNSTPYISTMSLDEIGVEDGDHLNLTVTFEPDAHKSTVAFWVNGVQLGAAVEGPGYGSGRVIHDSSAPLLIGARTDLNPYQYFPGTVERVRIASAVEDGRIGEVTAAWLFDRSQPGDGNVADQVGSNTLTFRAGSSDWGDYPAPTTLISPAGTEAHSRVVVGDVDGDGADDLMWLDSAASGTVRVLTGGASSFGDGGTADAGLRGDYQAFSGDINGDGYAELYAWDRTNRAWTIVANTEGALEDRLPLPGVGPVAHYDADAITGLTDNDSVSMWQDISGNANHVTQPTSGARPTYQTDEFAGKGAVTFGSGRRLYRFTSEGDSLDLTAATIFAAVDADADAIGSNAYVVSKTNRNSTSTSSHNQLHLGQVSNKLSGGSWGKARGFDKTFSGNPEIVSTTSDGTSTTNITLHVNGETPDSYSTATATGVFREMFNIGSRSSSSGGTGGGTDNFYGAIGEIIIYDRVLDAAERQAVETRLMGKWLVPAGTNLEPLVGDFNGDTLTDLAWFDADTGNYWVSASNGTTLEAPVNWGTHAAGEYIHIPGDYNGDGIDDIATHNPTTGEWVVAVSDGDEFTISIWGAQVDTGVHMLAGDFVGNGRTNIVYLAEAPNNQWRGLVSTGATLRSEEVWVEENPAASGTWECAVDSTNNPNESPPGGCITVDLDAGQVPIRVWAQTTNLEPRGSLRVAYSGPDTGDLLTVIGADALSHELGEAELVVDNLDPNDASEVLRLHNPSPTDTVEGTLRLSNSDGVIAEFEVSLPAEAHVDIWAAAGVDDASNIHLNTGPIWRDLGDNVYVDYLDEDTGTWIRVLRDAYGDKAAEITGVAPGAAADANTQYVVLSNTSTFAGLTLTGAELVDLVGNDSHTFGTLTLGPRESIRLRSGSGVSGGGDEYANKGAWLDPNGLYQLELYDSSSNLLGRRRLPAGLIFGPID